VTLHRPTTETTGDGAAPTRATVRDRAAPLLVEVAVEPDPTLP
jgi:hypothetical protein